MIVGAGVVPTAPLLVDGVSRTLPFDVVEVATAVAGTLAALPPHDLQVLVTPAPSQKQAPRRLRAALAGIGRPDLIVERTVDSELAERLVGAPLTPAAAGPAALDLLVLVHLLGPSSIDIAPVAVAAITLGDFCAAAERLVKVLDGPRRTVLIGTGDLSAGLSASAPLHAVDGAQAWDDCAVDAVRSGRVDRLVALGPRGAERVGARGWPSLATVAAVCDALGLTLEVRHYAAPRGVGYLVAGSAPRRR